jgi:hypothetical protein
MLDWFEEVDHDKVTTQHSTEQTYVCDRDNNHENVKSDFKSHLDSQVLSLP